MTNFEETWVAASCTLPTVEQPVRVAEFDDLFATAVRAVERPTVDRLVVVLDAEAEPTARDLAARESGCCSFFGFDFTPFDETHVQMMVTVPAGRVDVLDALARRAAAGAGLAVS